ncbi:cytochrome P450 [Plastoroseomonas arctica]|uniref:Cytochrome P450 n=1 Tax=Plastoroseomonas arctica TaxID=1509237 RepID=A0AAF1KJL1_9PROT|nr:cytochrome P450 [Plastoroseomonas arctica]MBR0655395.1 cytochrome P450 [Plastoroseomonas arctica]
MADAKPDELPPMPRIPRRAAAGLLGLLRARGDILSAFPEEAYRREVFTLRLPRRLLLVANHPDVVRDIFVLRHETYQAKSTSMVRALEPVIGDSLFINHGAVWEQRRAAIAPALHIAGLAAFEAHFATAAEELVEVLASGPAEVEIGAPLAAATARVMMLALFGGASPPAAANALAARFTLYQQAAEHLDVIGLLGLPALFGRGQGLRARTHAAALRAMVGQALENVGTPTPVMEALRTAAGDSAEALVNETAMMLLAGSETAANALTWTLWLLATHAEARAQVLAEIDRLPPRAPDVAALAALPYARMVLYEAMRLYPPVPVLSREALAPGRIRRWEVPKGSFVLAVPWLIHRHSAWWEAPHSFRPERFSPEAARLQPKFTWLPFGLGPRVCAGAAFGMAEMLTFLAVLLRRFSIAPAPGFVPRPRARLTLRPAAGMRLLLTPRGG